jgi:hypothetical protein
MPAAGWTKRTYTGPRPWEIIEAQPFGEVADRSRGQLRLAAEVAVAELRGQAVPTWVHERAFETLNLMAFA